VTNDSDVSVGDVSDFGDDATGYSCEGNLIVGSRG
jgi:hypothetical protein